MPEPKQTGTARGGCLTRIRALVNQAPPSAARIGRCVLADAERARNLSVTALARAAGVSQAAVSRFCATLGYAGFKAFQLDLATALAQAGPAKLDDFVPGESPAATIARVFEGNRRTLSETEQILDGPALVQVAQAMERAGRIVVLGLGASALIARYAVQRFLGLGLNAVAAEDPYDQLFVTASVRRGDVVIGISHSGETRGVVEAIQEAGRHAARTVALTNYPQSTLAGASEFCLITAFRENQLSTAFSSSHVAQMSVIDSLYFLAAAHRRPQAVRLARDVERRARKVLRDRVGCD